MNSPPPFGVSPHVEVPARPLRCRHHWRRHRRRLHCLSPGQDRHHQYGGSGAQAAHLRNHVACGGPCRAIARLQQSHRAGEIHHQPFRRTGEGNRTGHRLQAEWLDLDRAHRRPHGGTAARRFHGQEFWTRGRCDQHGEIKERVPHYNHGWRQWAACSCPRTARSIPSM